VIYKVWDKLPTEAFPLLSALVNENNLSQFGRVG
jgi:hypothetical protein